jgi:hypothetical protein
MLLRRKGKFTFTFARFSKIVLISLFIIALPFSFYAVASVVDS